MDSITLPIAAIVHDHEDEADQLLQGLVADLRRQGLDVRGLAMVKHGAGHGRVRRCLQDVHTGERFLIFQDLGAGSQACCLDITRLAAASGVLRAAIQARPALAVVNRFGRQEASGGGFVQEILGLIEADIPVLTIVAGEFLADWRRFTGGLGEELPASEPGLRAWAGRWTGSSPRCGRCRSWGVWRGAAADRRALCVGRCGL
ncbi:DUF2478 domain-containing protein [Castellaniella hirudinis]|uniref:DUF2478 domain-containing protein n=1 Tax=Castellaniella hirudinis TaxID=1144617 RepID=UPI0039C1B6CD